MNHERAPPFCVCNSLCEWNACSNAVAPPSKAASPSHSISHSLLELAEQLEGFGQAFHSHIVKLSQTQNGEGALASLDPLLIVSQLPSVRSCELEMVWRDVGIEQFQFMTGLIFPSFFRTRKRLL